MNMNKKNILAASLAAIGLVMALVWIQGGFHPKMPGGKTIAPEADAGEFKTEKVEVVQSSGQVTMPGTVWPRETARIAAKVSGYVVGLNVDAGDKVTKGQELLRLESKELQERQRQAGASLESAQADLVKAGNDFERYKTLFEKQSIAKKDYDDAVARLETAKAAELRAKAALDESATLLSYATVTAPFDGIIGERTINLGDLATPGRNLFSVYVPDTLELVAAVGEQYAPYLPVGASVTVAVPSLGVRQSSTIREVVPLRGEKTRTITVKAPVKEAAGFVPGLYGMISFNTQESTTILVPLSALSTVGQLEAVRVIESGKVKIRHVKTGRKMENGKVEILSGLNAGEELIIK